MIQEIQIPNRLRSAVIFLVLLTPTATNLLEHAGSVIILLLTILGIYIFYQQGRIPYARREKQIIWVFAAYFFFSLVMSAAHNFAGGVSLVKINVDHSLRMLSILPIYYLFIKARLEIKAIWYSVIAGAIVSGMYALFTSIATDFSSRIIGPYNPCLFGYFSVALAFMSLSGYHYFYKKNKKLIILPLLGFTCGLLAAFFSGTRGSVITIPFLTIVFMFQIRRHLSNVNTKLVVVFIAAVFVFLVILFPHTPLSERFSKGIDEARYYIKNHECVECIGRSDAHHLRMWMEALLIIKDHPVAGVGAKGYRRIVTDRVNNHEIAPGIEIFKTPHNMYLTMLTSYGIFGLIVLLAFFLVPLSAIIYAVKNSRHNSDLTDISYCGIFLIVGYMLFSMTGALFIRNMLITFYVVSLSAVLSVNRPMDPGP
jgi:O-antigen ligase